MSFSRLKSASLSLLFGVTSILGINIPKANASWDSDVPNNYVTHLALSNNQSINIHQPRNGQWINSWDNINGDKDQELKIVSIGGNKVYIFKNGTNMLLSVKDNPVHGSELEAWNYVQGSWAQVWEMVPASVGGAYTIRLAAKPHLGITIPGGQKDRRITLANIGHGNTTQEFFTSFGYQGTATVNPGSWVQPINQPVQTPAPVVNKNTQTQTPTPFVNTYTKRIKLRGSIKPGTKLACGPATPLCYKAAEIVVVVTVTLVVQHIYNERMKKFTIKWVNSNSDGASWDEAAKACDTEDNYNDGYLQDHKLVWYKNPNRNVAEKTCVF